MDSRRSNQAVFKDRIDSYCFRGHNIPHIVRVCATWRPHLQLIYKIDWIFTAFAVRIKMIWILSQDDDFKDRRCHIGCLTVWVITHVIDIFPREVVRQRDAASVNLAASRCRCFEDVPIGREHFRVFSLCIVTKKHIPCLCFGVLRKLKIRISPIFRFSYKVICLWSDPILCDKTDRVVILICGNRHRLGIRFANVYIVNISLSVFWWYDRNRSGFVFWEC